MQITDGNRAPNLLPVILFSAWSFGGSPTGGRDIFVNEVLGDAYDSQAEHFLRGDVGVDVAASRWETMMVNGKARIYFGPFPSFARMPLNYLYPAGRGAWSRFVRSAPEFSRWRHLPDSSRRRCDRLHCQLVGRTGWEAHVWWVSFLVLLFCFLWEAPPSTTKQSCGDLPGLWPVSISLCDPERQTAQH